MGLLKKLFGTTSEKELKAISPIVNKIEALEPEYAALTDEQLQAKTPEFKQRYQNGENLDALLPEAFAACREAAWRVLGMKPYRVQLIGGIILHQGRLSERPGRRRGPHRYRQRLSGQARQRVDGQGLSFYGPLRGPGDPRRAGTGQAPRL